ncbi:MAG TPA: hypothetical protein VFP72_19425 [Kineosporiaceae bacterium]|nr:hypothetical protein [Kineosporiaceae bacterium]
MSQDYPPRRPTPRGPAAAYPPDPPTPADPTAVPPDTEAAARSAGGGRAAAGRAGRPIQDVAPGPGGSSTKEVAQGETAAVGGTAKEAGQHVAGTAREQASHVAEEAGRQVRGLADRTRGELAEQAAQQQRKVVDGLRSLEEQLRRMVEQAEPGSTTTDLVHQASDKVGEAARWLDAREPGDVVNEVRRFAQRRPGTFLAIAAGAGLLAGRLTRGAVEAAQEDGSRTAGYATATGYGPEPTGVAGAYPPPELSPAGPPAPMNPYPPGPADPGTAAAPGTAPAPGTTAEPVAPYGRPGR